jgi:hypothetical protein
VETPTATIVSADTAAAAAVVNRVLLDRDMSVRSLGGDGENRGDRWPAAVFYQWSSNRSPISKVVYLTGKVKRSRPIFCQGF